MKMIPEWTSAEMRSSDSDFGPDSERYVFNWLEKGEYPTKNVPPPIAYHSLAIANHTTQRFGEADFVILFSNTILILEVKGGRISYKDGNWFTGTENRGGKS